jgi:ribosomal protein S2, bacterial type
MNLFPSALIIVDGKTEYIAIQEAKKLEIPIICIVDSNTDPSLCDYPIPANDDSIRTIQLIVNEVANTIISVTKKDDDKSESVSDDKEVKEDN